MNKLITRFINLQVRFFMLFGYQTALGEIGYSIPSRIRGRLGLGNHVDSYATFLGLERIKYGFIYESNQKLRLRCLEVVRGRQNGRI